jgi:hypothetical protein
MTFLRHISINTGGENMDKNEYESWQDARKPTTYVTPEDALRYGNEEQKAWARRAQAAHERRLAGQLKSPEQLPDIDEKEIIVTLREEEGANEGDEDIVLYWKDKVLWREEMGYEYYERYLALGKILQEKYGERLIDFEAAYSVYLLGDSSSAASYVRDFRKSLRKMT